MEKCVNLGEMRFAVRMWSSTGGEPCGEVSYFNGENQPEKRSFGTLSQLLLELDEVCSEQGHPQQDTDLRSVFARGHAKKSAAPERPVFPPQGETLSFSLSVCMRQHSSIQGLIQTESKKTFYRSGIELMKLLQELCGGLRVTSQEDAPAITLIQSKETTEKYYG